jgi:hypothetical protein
MQRLGNQNKRHLINVPIIPVQEALSFEPLLSSRIIIFTLAKCNLFKARRKREMKRSMSHRQTTPSFATVHAAWFTQNLSLVERN